MFYQNGRKVFKEVLPLAINLITRELVKNNIEPEKVARYWLHQANINMNRIIAEKLMGKNYAAERAPVVLDEFANTGSAGSLVAFYKYHRDLEKGADAVLCSFGAGYSIGCIILQKI
jgi:beta-ketodecanoyl-[acyl-carrier-protein] synthase